MNGLQRKWEDILLDRGMEFEHAAYPISQWKRDVLSGTTRRGYAEIVARMLFENRHVLPSVLEQFRPRTVASVELRRAAFAELDANTYCVVHKPERYVWFLIKRTFEDLQPFVVADVDSAFIVAFDTSRNRSRLRRMEAAVIYEWDAAAVPKFNDA